MIERKFMSAHNVLGYAQTGSSYICNPPVLDTDEDWVLLVHNQAAAKQELLSLGYTFSAKDKEGYNVSATPDPFQPHNRFDAYRNPDTNENLIVVDNPYSFMQWKTATALAKRLNLTDKDDRIAMFRAVRSSGLVL